MRILSKNRPERLPKGDFEKRPATLSDGFAGDFPRQKRGGVTHRRHPLSAAFAALYFSGESGSRDITR